MCADFFLRSTDGSDADNGTTWALAKATLTGAFAVMAAGDRVFVSNNHAETQATTMTLTSPGTVANPCQVLCVDDAGDPANPTTLAITATVTTTVGSAINFAGFAYCYGIIWNCGTGNSVGTLNFNSSSPWAWSLDSCQLKQVQTSNSAHISLGASGTGSDDSMLVLNNTPIQFGAVGQQILIRSVRFIWKNTVNAIAGSVPTTLIVPQGAQACDVTMSGLDLSAAGSGKNLVSVAGAAPHRVALIDCKLGASVSIITGTHPGPGGTIVHVYNCDAADTNYRNERYEYQGSSVTVTDVVRNGGANDGTTPFAHKLVSGANARFISALRSFPVVGWINSTGSKTLTLQYIHDGASALNNDELWMELEYLGTSGFPLALYATSAKANVLATAAANTADSAQDWDNGLTARTNLTAYSLNDIRRAATPNGRAFIVTTAGTSDTSQPAGFTTANDGDTVADGGTLVWRCMRREKVSVTVTVNEIGPFRVWALLGRASTTCWIDPKVVVT